MRETVTEQSQTFRAEVEAVRFVALVGTPNSGKTTLFNWLTGSKFKTVNYPGATVDYSIGKSHARYGESFLVMDTPGTYSLDPKSPDERVTHEAIFAHKTYGHASLVVAIADATHLARQLLLTQQLLDAGFRVVLAVTMDDLLKEHDEEIDTQALSKELGIPVVVVDGRLGGGISTLVETVRRELAAELKTAKPKAAWDHERIETTTRNMRAVVTPHIRKKQKSTSAMRATARERTKRIDRWLLHPFWGLVIFVSLMSALFSSIFWVATPAMDLVDSTFSAMAAWVSGLEEGNLFLRFLSDGVIASVSAVLIFVPQIFILFIGIILLEDSGYLARSATLVDRPLSRLGMGGRSFVPLLSGYACAVPAMMAARTINSRRERWLTLFILPLMSCSARLPVYALLLAFLFHGESAWLAGFALTGIYLGSLVVGAIGALIASKLIKIEDKSFFMLELPVYRRPRAKLVLRQALTRTFAYVRRAGPPIFIFAVLVWVGTNFPNFREEDATVRLNTSYASQLGQVIEPVFEPIGGDWRTGVGLISAFAAREVFVSSLAVVFQVADDEATMQDTLLTKMKEAKAPNGYPLFTLASVLGLIVFFMIALQCLSTVVMAAREAGGWKFAIVQLVVFNVVAYVLALAIVQGLRAVGIA
ncbi:MAG: ferrous iron transporter B [Bdellovibrionota bacterium]